jgi:hypothetical protein
MTSGGRPAEALVGAIAVYEGPFELAGAPFNGER